MTNQDGFTDITEYTEELKNSFKPKKKRIKKEKNK